MLGCAGEAEDVVQEAWIRWQNCDRGKVRHARAFLSKTTSRLASNAAQSARARHETHAGQWQAEPVDTGATPELAAEHGEALEVALRLTLEKLSPSERAAYVLRHAFDYTYEQIAEILQQTQASVRQHVSRACKRLRGGKQPAAVDSGKHRQLLDAIVAGAQQGDLAALERLLAADVLNDGSRTRRAQITASTTRAASMRSSSGRPPRDAARSDGAGPPRNRIDRRSVASA
jgi:RNA polymerase sigma-70 factor (ECF subfamily)